MHARYYDRNFARFTRPDPAFDFNPVNPFSFNLYGYTRNNPVNAWDPDGLQTVGQYLDSRGHYHAMRDNDVRGYFFTFAKLGWDVFGMESLSSVTDQAVKGQEIDKGDVAMATLDIGTGGKGGAARRALGGIGSKIRRIFSRAPKKPGKNIDNIASTSARRVGDILETVDDVLANPNLLKGKGLDEVRSTIGNAKGWKHDVMRHSSRVPDGGWVFREMNKAGTDFTGRIIQFHPGTPRHFGGKPYWKVSAGGTKPTVRLPAQ
jgi:uncharacterized protein RhaS with RHS repeats